MADEEAVESVFETLKTGRAATAVGRQSSPLVEAEPQQNDASQEPVMERLIAEVAATADRLRQNDVVAYARFKSNLLRHFPEVAQNAPWDLPAAFTPSPLWPETMRHIEAVRRLSPADENKEG